VLIVFKNRGLVASTTTTNALLEQKVELQLLEINELKQR